jgi:hypothetical protein
MVNYVGRKAGMGQLENEGSQRGCGAPSQKESSIAAIASVQGGGVEWVRLAAFRGNMSSVRFIRTDRTCCWLDPVANDPQPTLEIEESVHLRSPSPGVMVPV